MKRVLKYILAVIGFGLFILFIDGSFVGTKEQIKKVKEWADK